MGGLQNVLYFVVFLGVLVTVHEAGHFLVAKACGVKVLRFSIGFGPRIFGFTRGETEYRIAWIPLGGYVKMAGELPGDEVEPEDAKRSFLNQPPWKRGAIVVAGPAFNLIFPVLAYFFVFLGNNEVISTRVGWVDASAPAAMAGIRPGDRVKSVDGHPVRTFQEIQEVLVDNYEHPIEVVVERDGVDVVTRPVPSKQVTGDQVEKVTRGVIGISPYPRSPIVGVPAGSPAEAAGLKSFDRIASLNGQPVTDESQLAVLLKGATGPLKLTVLRSSLHQTGGTALVVPEVAELTVERAEGEGYAALGGAEAADLYVWNVWPDTEVQKAGIARGDRLVAIDGKPLSSWDLLVYQMKALEKTPFKLTWRSGSTEKTQALAQSTVQVQDEFKTDQEILDIGLRPRMVFQGAPDVLARGPEPERTTIKLSVKQAALASVKIVPTVIRKISIVIVKLFTGEVAFNQVGGPIMLYQVAARSAENGLDTFVEAMAVLSINLGLMNLLPIPVLDGFALLAAIWEGIRRRPIPIKAREYANMVGLAMLALLMVMVLKNDFTRLLH